MMGENVVLQPELKRALVALRSHGKQLFLATNFSTSTTESVMAKTFGSNW